MGCDIHAHVEIKIKGKWEHYNIPMIRANYELFARLANVRNDFGITPISQPRGLPVDVSVVTKFDSDNWGVDGHSHSWLCASEAQEVQDWHEDKWPPKDIWRDVLWGYVHGNYIGTHLKYPEDAETEFKLGFEDARVVFWFDN